MALRCDYFISIIAGISLCLLASSCSTTKVDTPWLEEKVSTDTDIEVPKKPNIVFILTDQERYPMHWPKGWAEDNLRSTQRLKAHGLFFNRAYTSACACSPSRAVMVTSEHYPKNTINETFPPLQSLPSANQLLDIGWLLTEKAGYEVVWKGKWHLSRPVEKGFFTWTEEDIPHLKKAYYLSDWNPPDAGNVHYEFLTNKNENVFRGLTTLGGGYANNDGRFVQGNTPNQPRETPGFGESALDYIKKVAAQDPETRKPFCLFISLVNPHDIWVYPKSWEKAGYIKSEFANLGIPLPSNYIDDLKTKPMIQRQSREAYDEISALENQQAELEYVNFYAYLTKLVDQHIETVLDALDEAGLTENTVIIRTSDHGEGALSHGLREKYYSAYEEMIHIPFIVSNPKMYPKPLTTDAFYCHLDLLPTLAQIAGVPNYTQYGKGVSLVEVLKNPSESVQEGILFTFDDVFYITLTAKRWHIRAIREGDWTYAVYYTEDGSQFEYEMYNNKDDPGQLMNLLYGQVNDENKKQASRLHANLTKKIQHCSALPEGFLWPQPYQGSTL